MLFATWVTALNILVFAALVAAVIYLFVLIVRALKKYAVVTGGDKPHVGAISVYSKEEGIKTISLKNHKDYIIGEIFINSIKDSFNGNISVSCGIHIDNISKEQIEDVYECCNKIFQESKAELYKVTTNRDEHN